MNIIERTIASIAPHRCIICGFAGELLCTSCRGAELVPSPPRCYRCHKTSVNSKVCNTCRQTAKISHAWVAAEYKDSAKELVHRFKFERASAAAGTIAAAINDVLPVLPDDLIVSHIPTANARVRMRGYDQSRLIAKELCRLRGWKYQSLLVRIGSFRQVGSSRKERFQHIKQSLKAKNGLNISGRHILLVDDVTTTGATIETAARLIKNAGAKTVDVAVFAQPD